MRMFEASDEKESGIYHRQRPTTGIAVAKARVPTTQSTTDETVHTKIHFFSKTSRNLILTAGCLSVWFLFYYILVLLRICLPQKAIFFKSKCCNPPNKIGVISQPYLPIRAMLFFPQERFDCIIFCDIWSLNSTLLPWMFFFSAIGFCSLLLFLLFFLFRS